MQLFIENTQPHISQVFPADFQERLARSLDVVRELRRRGVVVIRTDAASGEMPVIEITPAHAKHLAGIGHGHRMVRTEGVVVTHGLYVNGCEVVWYGHTLPGIKQVWS